MSTRVFGSLLALTLSTALSGCGVESVHSNNAQALAICPALPGTVILSEDFEHGLNGWQVYTDGPAQPGHTWTLEAGALRSDPDGSTVATYYNRIDSPKFSLVGKQDVRLQFSTQYLVSANGYFQVFVSSAGGAKRSLILDFNGVSAGFPGQETVSVEIPAAFWGDADVQVQFQMWGGPTGGDFGAVVDNIEVLGNAAAPSNAVLFDDFEGDLSKWDVYSDPNVDGHIWAQEDIAPGCPGSKVARSDLAGVTIEGNYTRLESKPFSLVGKSSAKIVVDAKYSLAPGDRYQVFVADMDSDSHRSLIAEFQGQNGSYPGMESQTFEIPADFLGLSRVRIAFLEINGQNGPGYGIALDNVKVLAE